MPRAAFPASSVAPTGVCSLMPPQSQGAERRMERRASRTGSRWGLRALVIGGLAGVAWLLTGAAAHAADRDPAPEGSPLGSSLIGSVVHGDAAQPAVVRVLQAAARPLESDRPAHRHHGTASLLAAPVRAIAQPAETLTTTLSEATRKDRTTDATTVLGGVDRVVRELTGPLRLTGGPEDSPLAPVTAPLIRTLRPVTDLLPHTAMPAMTAQRPIAAPAVHRTTTGSGVTDTGPAPKTIVGTAGSGSVWHPVLSGWTATDRTVVHRHRVTATAIEPEAVREPTPGGDGPAPLRVHLGAVSGIPTTGSGAPTEGGSAAFLPAAVAASSMAFHRLPIATDVKVRRNDAEAPTVSPD